jgi:hypothetical protein
MGLAPQSAPRDASDLNRSLFSPAVIKSCAAVLVPMPRACRSPGLTAATSFAS